MNLKIAAFKCSADRKSHLYFGVSSDFGELCRAVERGGFKIAQTKIFEMINLKCSIFFALFYI